MIIVAATRNAYLQAHADQTHAEAVLPNSLAKGTLKALRLGEKRRQMLWKERVFRDEDGIQVDLVREEAGTITLVRVENLYVADVTLEIARACGYKTSLDLREEWEVRHPRSPEVAIVWYALGDWCDDNRYLAPSGGAGGDFTTNPRRSIDADAPVLTNAQIEALSAVNRQKDDGRRAAASAALAAESSSERYRRLMKATERMGDEARRAIRQEIRIIEQRVQRGEGRK